MELQDINSEFRFFFSQFHVYILQFNFFFRILRLHLVILFFFRIIIIFFFFILQLQVFNRTIPTIFSILRKKVRTLRYKLRILTYFFAISSLHQNSVFSPSELWDINFWEKRQNCKMKILNSDTSHKSEFTSEFWVYISQLRIFLLIIIRLKGSYDAISSFPFSLECYKLLQSCKD